MSKMTMMKGNLNILGAVVMSDPLASTYTATYRGLNSPHSVKPFALDCRTSFSGTVLPDPQGMEKTSARYR